MKYIFAYLILALSFAHAAENAVVSEIQNTFKAVQSLEADFDQTVRSTRFGEKKSSGKLLLERPGKMIWSYKNPKGKVFAANGDIITLYDPEEKQALVSPQPKGGQLPAGFSFLMGQSVLTDRFNVEVVSDIKNSKGKRQVMLLCKPNDGSTEFKTLELLFEWSPNPVLVSSKTKDMLDSENEIVFGRMKTNVKVSKTAFDVKLPKGVPVVTNNSL